MQYLVADIKKRTISMLGDDGLFFFFHEYHWQLPCFCRWAKSKKGSQIRNMREPVLNVHCLIQIIGYSSIHTGHRLFRPGRVIFLKPHFLMFYFKNDHFFKKMFHKFILSFTTLTYFLIAACSDLLGDNLAKSMYCSLLPCWKLIKYFGLKVLLNTPTRILTFYRHVLWQNPSSQGFFLVTKYCNTFADNILTCSEASLAN